MGIMDAIWPNSAMPALALAAGVRDVPAAGGTFMQLATLSALTTAASAADLAQAVVDATRSAYERAPALVLGLGALGAVPVVAVVGWLITRLGASEGDARTVLMRRKGTAAGSGTTTLGRTAARSHGGALEWSDASGGARRLVLTRELVRVGREPDNDIVLDDRTVHRYHAAIHRPDGSHTVVTDLSGSQGNGVLVNGSRVTSRALQAGDVIELGEQRLTFTN